MMSTTELTKQDQEIARREQEKKEFRQSIATGPRGIVLRNLDDATTFAYAVFLAGCAGRDCKRKEHALMKVMAGQELGLAPMQSIANIMIINNLPKLWGDSMKGLVEQSPECEYVKEWIEGTGDNMVAHCEAKRKNRPEPTTRTFSIDDARQARLLGKDSYEKHPKRMIQMRARSFALRDQFADLLCGMGMVEEAGDYPQEGVVESGGVVPAMDLDSIAEQTEEEMGAVKITSETGRKLQELAETPTEPTIDEQIEAEDAEKAAKKVEEENAAIARGEPVVVDKPLFPL